MVRLGTAVESSRAALLLLHGRNAGPENILELARLLPEPAFTYLAPAAANGSWYPYSFLSELTRNEPFLSAALERVDRLLAELELQGVPRRRTVLLGFSQGGCLAAEYAVRHASRLGGVIVLSGGLIGPPGTEWRFGGDFAGTPVLLGCSDSDPHIPRDRVAESARVFERMGAAVTERIYSGLGHQVNDDELEFTRRLLRQVALTE